LFTALIAQEKHVPIRSGKQTTHALSKSKGNAVKDQHRNDTQPTPCLFRPVKAKRPLPSAAFKLNFSFPSTQKVAEAKNLISQDGRTTRRDEYQSQQGMMKNDSRKNDANKI